MAASLTVTPVPSPIGGAVDVDGRGFDPRSKFNLTTVNDICQEVGMTTNVNRPKRNGTFSVGINLPPGSFFPTVRAYQSGVKVAEITVRAR